MPELLHIRGSLSLYEPLGFSPVLAAVEWLQATLLGAVATSVAVVAVSAVAVMMLTGRVSLRYGATVILGCFVVFGASSIAAGIQLASAKFGERTEQNLAAVNVPPVVIIPASQPVDDDPYDGASVPMR